jgi:hypothetical protein
MTDHELLVHISSQLSTIGGLLGAIAFLVFLIAGIIWTRKGKE